MHVKSSQMLSNTEKSDISFCNVIPKMIAGTSENFNKNAFFLKCIFNKLISDDELMKPYYGKFRTTYSGVCF